MNHTKKAGTGQKASSFIETSPTASAADRRGLREPSLVVENVILALAFVSLLLSTYSFVKVNQIAKIVARQDASVGDVLKKMTAHPEALRYVGMKPMAMLQVDQNNLESLAKQVNGLGVFAMGSYLVRYSNVLFLYNYAQDLLLGATELQPQTETPPQRKEQPGQQPQQPAQPQSEPRPVQPGGERAAPQKPTG
jgi:hypothetical protein